MERVRIKRILLRNWLSFDRCGIDLELDSINAIIGPNNAGKSNVLRFLLEVTNLNFQTFTNENSCIKTPYALSKYLRNNFCENTVTAKLLIEYELHNIKRYRWIYIYYRPFETICYVSRCYLTPVEAPSRIKQRISELSIKLLYVVCNSLKYLTNNRNPYFLNNEIKRDYFHKNTHNGSEIYKVLDDYFLKKDPYETYDFVTTIEEWTTRIFKEKISFENYGNDEPSIGAESEFSQYTFDINYMGSGVAQVLIILTLLYDIRYNKKNIILLLEEPEINLHPHALSSLYKIIEEEFNDFQIIITTHSSILIDQGFKRWKIFNAIREKTGTSKIECCKTQNIRLNMLDELGAKASHLLLSNAVIWVEGPSDVNYIRNWIKKSSDLNESDEIEEGIHFSFQMYGGSNIKNHSVELEPRYAEDLISIVNLSHYAIIVFDNDNRNLDNRKAGISKIIEEANKNKRIFLWETRGREIENYIPNDLMTKALKSKGIVSKKINGIDVFPMRNLKPIYFKSNDKFQKHFKFMYEFSVDQVESYLRESFPCSCNLGCEKCMNYKNFKFKNLIESIYKGIENNMVKKKNNISLYIGERWENDYCTNDLKQDLAKIINHIKLANSI